MNEKDEDETSKIATMIQRQSIQDDNAELTGHRPDTNDAYFEMRHMGRLKKIVANVRFLRALFMGHKRSDHSEQTG